MAWDAAVEAEVLRSTAEQGLPVEVDDETAIDRVARVLAQNALDTHKRTAVARGSRGAA